MRWLMYKTACLADLRVLSNKVNKTNNKSVQSCLWFYCCYLHIIIHIDILEGNVIYQLATDFSKVRQSGVMVQQKIKSTDSVHKHQLWGVTKNLILVRTQGSTCILSIYYCEKYIFLNFSFSYSDKNISRNLLGMYYYNKR